MTSSHSVQIPWTSDRSVATTNNTGETTIHAPGGFLSCTDLYSGCTSSLLFSLSSLYCIFRFCLYGIYFFILLFALCTLSVLVSLSGLSCSLPFVFTVQHTQHKRPCSQRDSNPHPQQASGHRSTPWTARPLGSAIRKHMTKRPLASCTVLYGPALRCYKDITITSITGMSSKDKHTTNSHTTGAL